MSYKKGELLGLSFRTKDSDHDDFKHTISDSLTSDNVMKVTVEFMFEGELKQLVYKVKVVNALIELGAWVLKKR